MTELSRIDPKIALVHALVCAGLATDGAHHKQWYLEQIAELLNVDLSQVDYEKGIAP